MASQKCSDIFLTDSSIFHSYFDVIQVIALLRLPGNLPSLKIEQEIYIFIRESWPSTIWPNKSSCIYLYSMYYQEQPYTTVNSRSIVTRNDINWICADDYNRPLNIITQHSSRRDTKEEMSRQNATRLRHWIQRSLVSDKYEMGLEMTMRNDVLEGQENKERKWK